MEKTWRSFVKITHWQFLSCIEEKVLQWPFLYLQNMSAIICNLASVPSVHFRYMLPWLWPNMYVFQIHYFLFWFFFFYFVQVVALTLLCGTLPINWINVIFFHWNVLYYINLWFRSLNFVQSLVHFLELPERSINSNKLANCAKWNSVRCVGFES